MISPIAACCGTTKRPEHDWPARRRSVKSRNIVARWWVIKNPMNKFFTTGQCAPGSQVRLHASDVRLGVQFRIPVRVEAVNGIG